MSQGFLSVNVALHNAVLIDTDSGQDVQHILVARVDTVEHESDHNLLPGRTTLVPEFRLLYIDDIANILHNTVQGTSRERLVFIVVGDRNQELCVSIIHRGTKVITVVEGEFIGVASSSSVFTGLLVEDTKITNSDLGLTSHVSEFLASTFKVIAIFGLDGILNSARDGIVNTQD